jgi:hypothetical protein
MRNVPLATGVLVALWIAPARAVAQTADAPSGYFFVGGLNAFEDFPGAPDTSYDDSFGLDVRLGWRLVDYLALELEGNFISGFDVDVPTGTGIAKLVLEGGNVTANVRAVLPLGRFEPYVSFGLGGMWADLRTRNITGVVCTPGFLGWWCTGTTSRIDDAGAFVTKYGGGIDFWVSDDFGLTVDAVYVRPTGDLEDLKYTKLGWGIKFRF